MLCMLFYSLIVAVTLDLAGLTCPAITIDNPLISFNINCTWLTLLHQTRQQIRLSKSSLSPACYSHVGCLFFPSEVLGALGGSFQCSHTAAAQAEQQNSSMADDEGRIKLPERSTRGKRMRAQLQEEEDEAGQGFDALPS